MVVSNWSHKIQQGFPFSNPFPWFKCALGNTISYCFCTAVWTIPEYLWPFIYALHDNQTLYKIVDLNRDSTLTDQNITYLTVLPWSWQKWPEYIIRSEVSDLLHLIHYLATLLQQGGWMFSQVVYTHKACVNTICCLASEWSINKNGLNWTHDVTYKLTTISSSRSGRVSGNIAVCFIAVSTLPFPWTDTQIWWNIDKFLPSCHLTPITFHPFSWLHSFLTTSTTGLCINQDCRLSQKGWPDQQQRRAASCGELESGEISNLDQFSTNASSLKVVPPPK